MSRLVGNKAPDFKAQALDNGEFKEVSLSDYNGKWKMLFFYPLDFTFVCPTEIIAYSEAASQFKERGCELFSHLALTERSRDECGIGEFNFPILSDINKTIARDYEVLTDGGVALRGSFLIDPEGVIQQATVNNLSVGRNVEESLRLLKGYQYTAEHGEVCPAGWEEGGDTMVPDPEKSKEYFKKQK